MSITSLGNDITYHCDSIYKCDRTITRKVSDDSIQNTGWLATVVNGKWEHYCPIHSPINEAIPKKIYNTVPDAPIQSEVFQAMYRLDPMVLLELGRVMMVGEKSHNDTGTPIGQENWRKISFKDHFNHAFIHLVKDFQEQVYGEEVDDDEAGEHLAHAMCRLMFAMAVRNMENAHVE